MKEALFYKKLKDNNVQCIACNRYCIISLGSTGFCKVRKNIAGALYSLVYGKPITINIDPIEKKPIFDYLSGTNTLSFGTFGCNFDCSFCQNYNISNLKDEKQINRIKEITPQKIVSLAIENNCPSISYTYTEPTTFIEFAIDTMKLAKKNGIKNIWVTNGYMSRDVAKEIINYLDAINIDIKGDSEFYKKLINGADVNQVIKNIKYFHTQRIHVEVTNLLIEEENTRQEQIEWICKEIAKISKDIPIHFTRSFPYYKMQKIIPTRMNTLKIAEKIAKEKGIKKAYIGNI